MGKFLLYLFTSYKQDPVNWPFCLLFYWMGFGFPWRNQQEGIEAVNTAPWCWTSRLHWHCDCRLSMLQYWKRLNHIWVRKKCKAVSTAHGDRKASVYWPVFGSFGKHVKSVCVTSFTCLPVVFVNGGVVVCVHCFSCYERMWNSKSLQALTLE